MTAATAQANQALYLAKVLLAEWARAKQAEDLPLSTLDAAFAPGVYSHLRSAYGWFLLEIAGADAGVALPRSTDEIPPIPTGKALPGELRELAQLERSGWLADLQDRPVGQPGALISRNNLATPLSTAPDHTTLSSFADRLETLIARMRDSLDEY